MSELAITTTSEGHPNRSMCLDNLGNALVVRFLRTGSMDDLNRAISTFEGTVNSAPTSHPARETFLSKFSVALSSHFERNGSIEDLDGAIKIS